METVCALYYKTGEMTEDGELTVIDYLENNKIRVSLKDSKEELCYKAMLHKFGTQEKVTEFLYGENTLSNAKIQPDKYGSLGLAPYLSIALVSDDKTLLKLMNASKEHQKHFNDVFFKKYLETHYPNSLKYRGFDSYKKYYLKLIRAIDLLKRIYNFEYLPEEKYNVVQLYKDVERISNSGLNYESYLSAFKK